MWMTAKIDIFSLSNIENDESIKEADILSNKSKISFKCIRAKKYIYKMFKTSFYITFSKSWSIINDVFSCKYKQYIRVSKIFTMIV